MRELGKNEVMGIVAVIALVGVVYYIKKGAAAAADAAAAVATAVNPLSDQNLVNKSVNVVGQALTDQTTASGGTRPFSLGTWLYDVTHPSAIK